MTRRTDPDLARLADMADAVKSARLARLATARARRDATLELLAGLETAPAAQGDLSLLLAELRHRRWSETRRARLDADLRAVEAVIEVERAAAARALARCIAIGRLQRKAGRQPS